MADDPRKLPATGQPASPHVARARHGSFTVVLHDSAEHSLPYCVALLRQCFAYSEDDAYRLAYRVHLEGRATIWKGSFEVAEFKCLQVQHFVPKLSAAVSVSVPRRKKLPLRPMKVTIECVESNAGGNNPA